MRHSKNMPKNQATFTIRKLSPEPVTARFPNIEQCKTNHEDEFKFNRPPSHLADILSKIVLFGCGMLGVALGMTALGFAIIIMKYALAYG